HQRDDRGGEHDQRDQREQREHEPRGSAALLADFRVLLGDGDHNYLLRMILFRKPVPTFRGSCAARIIASMPCAGLHTGTRNFPAVYPLLRMRWRRARRSGRVSASVSIA